MKFFLRTFWALCAASLLTVYLLDDVPFMTGPQMMSWEEFSANPHAVAKFRERAGLDETGLTRTDETRMAYERYAARVAAKGSTATPTFDHGPIATFRSAWHSLYQKVVPKAALSKSRPAARPINAHPRTGMILVLVTLVALVIGLTVAIRTCERLART
jgi:hypothetical protein